MARFKIKSKWKSILCGILVIVTLIGACAGIAAIAKKDTKTIGAGAFSVGGIDTNGEYEKVTNSIFTKDMFLCQGLVIEPDFTLKTSYSVFFYNYDGVFLESFTNLTDKFVNRVPELAKYARISIKSIDDEDLNWFDCKKLAKCLDITVNAKQDFALTDWFEIDEEHTGVMVTYNGNAGKEGTNLYVQYVTNLHSGSSNADKAALKPVSVKNWKSVAFVYSNGNYSSSELVYFFAKPMYDAEGNRVVSTSGEEQWQIIPVDTSNVRFNSNMSQIVVEVPEGATHLFANTFIEENRHYSIYQYN